MKSQTSYFSLLVFLLLLTSACSGPYYARSFEENKIRRIAEDAEATQAHCEEIESQLDKQNEYLEGVVSQLSFVNSQAEKKAEQSRKQLKKLKVKGLPELLTTSSK